MADNMRLTDALGAQRTVGMQDVGTGGNERLAQLIRASTATGDTVDLATAAQLVTLIAAAEAVRDRIGAAADDEAILPGSQGSMLAVLKAVRTLIGAEGLGAPSLDGQGMLGYLRAILQATQATQDVRLRDSTGDSVMDDTNNAVRVNIVAGGGSGSSAVTADDHGIIVPGLSTTAYSVGDCVGTKILVPKLRGDRPHVYINGIELMSGAGGANTMGIRAILFNSDLTGTYTDNAPYNLHFDDRVRRKGAIDFARISSGGVWTLRPAAGQLPAMIVNPTAGADTFCIVLECTEGFTLDNTSNLRLSLSLAYS